MKCQHCEKPATFHITELMGPELVELHLCQDHAAQYLQQSEQATSSPSTLAGALVQQLQANQTAEELARLDKQACPVCGITFYEFRNLGRLGCPYDYVCFAKELEPLLVNIHGETTHAGKSPQRAAEATRHQTELIRLRREMKDAIDQEQYERASQLRDEIRSIQEKRTPQSGESERDPSAT